MYNPNTTILLAGCNAQCEFCSTKTYRHPKAYMQNLVDSINNLPEECTQVSISGGEPTINPHLEAVLDLAYRNFSKIVLNTNGSGLLDTKTAEYVAELVTHVNISRHHMDDGENSFAFGLFGHSTVPSLKQMKGITKILETNGVDTTLNCVYGTRWFSEVFDVNKFISAYVEMAKGVGASAVCFRYDMRGYVGGLNPVERHISKHRKIIARSECPVCRANAVIIDGMRVTFKSSVFEPSEVLGSGGRPYEYIIQPSGKTTIDWAGEVPFVEEIEERRPSQRSYKETNDEYHGCWGLKSPQVTSCGVGPTSRC